MLYDPLIVPCEVSKQDEVGPPPGMYPAGFSVVGGTPESGKVKISWSFPDPSVGYVSGGSPRGEGGWAGEDACFIFSLQQSLGLSDREETVPLATFLSGASFTLSSSGNRHFDRDLLGQPASIDYSWSVSLTLKRVDRDGTTPGRPAPSTDPPSASGPR